MSTLHYVMRYENSTEIVVVSDHGVTTARANHADCPACANVLFDLDDSEFTELELTDYYCHIEDGDHGVLVKG